MDAGFSVSALCCQSRGTFALSQGIHTPTSWGPALFADKGVQMQSASDAGVEKAKVKATLWLPLNYTHMQHDRLDF